MSGDPGIPEMEPAEYARRRARGDELVLLDVREPEELRLATLGDEAELAPLSRLAQRGVEALPPAARDQDAEIVVVCHHGIRSAQVVAWLRHHGWQNVWNLTGGIDAYAREVKPSVGFY